MARLPAGCHVRYVHLTPKGAEVSYDCGGKTGGGRGKFHQPGGGTGNYAHIFIPKVREVTTGSHGEAHTTGAGARVDFQLIPHAVYCKVRRTGHRAELVCRTRAKKSRKKGRR